MMTIIDSVTLQGLTNITAQLHFLVKRVVKESNRNGETNRYMSLLTSVKASLETGEQQVL